MSISSWPASERPRERLLGKGADTLSDAEVLAVLLRNGMKGKDAVSLARELLAKFGGLRGLFSLDSRGLKKEKGLGEAKIATLLAAAEIVKRKLREDLMGKNAVRDPEAVITYLQASLRDRKKEVFKVLFLDKANRILDEADLFHGTVDEAAIHPREVIKSALERHATALILVHNHPSGRTEPSAEDREITRRLHAACGAVGIKILDDLIIGEISILAFESEAFCD